MKIYRKIKEREKQQQKEEIKTKIINKQQALIKEAHGYQNIDYSLINVPSELSNSNDNESLIKVRIKCIPNISKKERYPKTKEKDIQKHTTATVIKSDEILSTIKYKEDVQVVESDKICCKQDYFNIKPFPIIRCSKNENKQNVFKCSTGDDFYLTKKYKLNLRAENQVKPVTSIFEQSVSKPKLSNICGLESKSIALDPTETVHMQNILSARSSIVSRQKSCKLYIVIHKCTYVLYMCV